MLVADVAAGQPEGQGVAVGAGGDRPVPADVAGRAGEQHRGRLGPAVKDPGLLGDDEVLDFLIDGDQRFTFYFPVTNADAAAGRDAQATALQTRLRQLESAQNAQILALEQLPGGPADNAATAMRARITARFAELHYDHQETQAQLDALAVATPKAADTSLLDQLPLAGGILLGLPSDLKTRLFDVFDLQILWNKPGQQ